MQLEVISLYQLIKNKKRRINLLKIEDESNTCDECDGRGIVQTSHFEDDIKGISTCTKCSGSGVNN